MLRLLGLPPLFGALYLLTLAYLDRLPRNWVVWCFWLGVSCYSGYVYFLAWYGFSQRAVRQVCLWNLLLAGWVVRLFIRGISLEPTLQGESLEGPLKGSATLILIVAMVWIYRRVTRYLLALIFPSPQP